MRWSIGGGRFSLKEICGMCGSCGSLRGGSKLGTEDGEKGDNIGSPGANAIAGSDEEKLRAVGVGPPYNPSFSRLDKGGGGENPAVWAVECSCCCCC